MAIPCPPRNMCIYVVIVEEEEEKVHRKSFAPRRRALLTVRHADPIHGIRVRNLLRKRRQRGSCFRAE